VNGFTAIGAAAQYRARIFSSRALNMVIDFTATMTEADFKRPLLDATEERLALEARGGVDLAVEGLRDSLFSWLVRQVSGGRSS
jgi:hypothetical protein